MTNTVMSKRYLRELVEMGIVDGWDDPRMPTLCGLRRRGYTPTSIFTFVREAGISKSDNLIDMRQLEACIRSELDLTAQRRIAVLDPVKLVEMGIVDGWDDPRMPTLCGLRRRGYTPVSYTHLDVYKRQILFIKPRTVSLCMQSRTMSKPAR